VQNLGAAVGSTLALTSRYFASFPGHASCSVVQLTGERIMDIRTARHYDQLNKRRHQVVLTLQHIEKERNEAEENTDWLDRAAYETRIALLDQLNEWYIQEINAIDKALDRINNNSYGFCLACHNPVERVRLDCFPDAVFCSTCQTTRESLQNT
jgi:DnaK suppressor protein